MSNFLWVYVLTVSCFEWCRLIYIHKIIGIKAADSKPTLTKKMFADLVCLFVEAARHDLDEESLRNFLCQACVDEQRRKKLCEVYINNKTTIQSRLELIGSNPPHIIDVDWRLDYRVKVIDRSANRIPNVSSTDALFM